MDTNPYESPVSPAENTASDDSPDRKAARLSLRVCLIILLLPGLYNYACFDSQLIGPLPPDLRFLLRAFNLAGIAMVSVSIWFFGLLILEVLTKLVHSSLSRSSDLAAWNESLYVTFRRAPYFAVAGSVLWIIWVYGFYETPISFYAISYPIGILAHLLAAGLYVPLFRRWYHIRRAHKTMST